MTTQLEQIRRQVYRNRTRARKVGEPATLTFKQWLATLEHFNYRCAYCGYSNGCWPIDMEHFVPLGLGAGTTQLNCVPSCLPCNIRKGSLHPALVKNLPQESIEHVREYLMSFL